MTVIIKGVSAHTPIDSNHSGVILLRVNCIKYICSKRESTVAIKATVDIVMFFLLYCPLVIVLYPLYPIS